MLPPLAIGISLVSRTRSMRDVLEFCESHQLRALCENSMQDPSAAAARYQTRVARRILLDAEHIKVCAICFASDFVCVSNVCHLCLEFESCAARPPLSAQMLAHRRRISMQTSTRYSQQRKETLSHTHARNSIRLPLPTTCTSAVAVHYSIVSCTKGFEIISRFNH